jgi:ABC-type polar amino acid transport system ATPase subunit
VGIAPESGTTMMPVTHEPGFADRHADRMRRLAGGRIHESGTPDEASKQLREERTRSFPACFAAFA